MRVFVLVSSGCLAIAPAILGATPAVADDQPIAPALGLMDNTLDGTELVLELATLIPNENANLVLVHPRMQLQHVAANGFGGYAGFSASAVLGGGDSGGSIGNLDLGGLYQHRIDPDIAIGVRAGLVLDTASDDKVVNYVATALVATALTRPGDLTTAVPGNWLRLGGSLRFRAGTGFMGVDAGVDVPLGSYGRDSIAHVNVGAGFLVDRWSVAAELGALRPAGGAPDAFTVVGLDIHYRGEPASPYFMISTPVHDYLGGRIITLTVGAVF